MMRLLTLLLLCLAIGIGSFLLTEHPAPDIELVDYLPEDTLLYMEVAHPAHPGEQWRFNRDEKAIPATTWYKILQQAGGSSTLIAETRQMVAAGEAFANHPIVSSLLGHGAAFALLPEPARQTEFSLFRQWMVAVRINDDRAAQRFGEVFARPRSRQPVSYQGETFWRLVVDDGREFFYWQHRDVVLVACEQTLIRRCIDLNLQRMTRKGATLSMNRAYLRLRQLNKGQADIFCYIDFEGLCRRVPLAQAIKTESGGLLPPCLAFRYRAAPDANLLELSALVNPASTAAFLARHALPAPVRQPPMMDPPPPEVKFALWTNWFKPKYLWDFVGQKVGDDVSALMASVGQQLSEATGKSLDDFFDVFGEEFGVMITEQQMEHQSSRFMGGLLVALHDRPAVTAMIEQMVAGLQVIKARSDDLEIDSVILAGGLLQPAYALLERHLILADSMELVEAARRHLMRDNIDSRQSKAPDHGGGLCNLSLFLRVGEMAERLMPLLTLLVKETGERGQILSYESRQFIQEVGLPLLATLNKVATGRFQGYMGEDTLWMKVEYTPRGD